MGLRFLGGHHERRIWDRGGPRKPLQSNRNRLDRAAIGGGIQRDRPGGFLATKRESPLLAGGLRTQTDIVEFMCVEHRLGSTQIDVDEIRATALARQAADAFFTQHGGAIEYNHRGVGVELQHVAAQRVAARRESGLLCSDIKRCSLHHAHISRIRRAAL